MGEYAEMAIEQEMSLDFDVPRHTKQELSQWKCRDGRVIKLTDMTQSHLIKTIAMLRLKNPIAFSDRISSMEAELKSRSPR